MTLPRVQWPIDTALSVLCTPENGETQLELSRKESVGVAIRFVWSYYHTSQTKVKRCLGSVGEHYTYFVSCLTQRPFLLKKLQWMVDVYKATKGWSIAKLQWMGDRYKKLKWLVDRKLQWLIGTKTAMVFDTKLHRKVAPCKNNGWSVHNLKWLIHKKAVNGCSMQKNTNTKTTMMVDIQNTTLSGCSMQKITMVDRYKSYHTMNGWMVGRHDTPSWAT